MIKKAYFLLPLIIIMGTTAIANADSKDALVANRFIEKGDLFSLQVGEAKEILVLGGRATVELLEIGYNPDEISDVQINEIILSDENPDSGEEIVFAVPVRNIGTGLAYGTSVDFQYGDEFQGGNGEDSIAVIPIILPGETIELEFAHTYLEDGYYNLMVISSVSNDINTGNNVVCEQLKVGNPEGESGQGGCGALPQQILPKDAHLIYTVNNDEQYDLWLSPEDVGAELEVIKLADNKILLTVPK